MPHNSDERGRHCVVGLLELASIFLVPDSWSWVGTTPGRAASSKDTPAPHLSEESLSNTGVDDVARLHRG